jgi:hypothetical protein
VGAFSVTVADPDFVTSACDTAVTITGLFGLGTTAGAAYNPFASTIPALALPPVTPFTCQVTAVFAVPLTAAENCCCCVGNALKVRGLTLTVTAGGPPPPPPEFPLPPQDVSTKVDATSMTNTVPAALRDEDFFARPPNIIPIADAQRNTGVHGFRFCALGRIATLPNPLVLIVSVTDWGPLAPDVIAGAEQVAPGGNPLQEKFTATGNEFAPTGVTSRLYGASCPGFRLCCPVLFVTAKVNSELKTAGAECATCAASVPAAFRLKL